MELFPAEFLISEWLIVGRETSINQFINEEKRVSMQPVWQI